MNVMVGDQVMNVTVIRLRTLRWSGKERYGDQMLHCRVFFGIWILSSGSQDVCILYPDPDGRMSSEMSDPERKLINPPDTGCFSSHVDGWWREWERERERKKIIEIRNERKEEREWERKRGKENIENKEWKEKRKREREPERKKEGRECVTFQWAYIIKNVCMNGWCEREAEKENKRKEKCIWVLYY